MELPWGFPIAVAAVFLTPMLLAAAFDRRGASLLELAPVAGLLAVLLHCALLVTLHDRGVLITPGRLAAVHAALFAVAAAACGIRCTRAAPRLFRREDRWAAAVLALYAVTVFPFTHLTGMDTYKWQDLATAVRVEGCIPWLSSPLAVFGFGPRAYPLAQPALLATAQMVGGLGVDAGYYQASLFCGFLGFTAFLQMSRTLFDDERTARLGAFLYLFAPVFLRYNHWATGRGLLMALMPVLIHGLARLRLAPSGLALPLLAGLAVALSHKAGLVAVILLPPAMLVSAWLPAAPWWRAALGTTAAAAAVIAAPSLGLPGLAGRLPGAAWLALSRFGILPPLAAVGFVAPWRADRRLRALALPAALFLVPALHAEMYAALLAAPFIAFYAARGLAVISRRLPQHRETTERILIAAALVAAAVTIVHHSRTAASREVRAAAAFLERYDPRGPFEVQGPGRARPLIQGYVSGSPRFRIEPEAARRLVPVPRPTLAGDPRDTLPNLIRWVRASAAMEGAPTEWYGENPRRYYVVIQGAGDRPADSRLIHSEEGLAIYADARNAEGPFTP